MRPRHLDSLHDLLTWQTACTGFRLRRYASALEVAERLFQEDDHEAWLWDWRKDPENTTILRVNAHPYAVQFALDIAQATGDSSQANLWAARAEVLGLGSNA